MKTVPQRGRAAHGSTRSGGDQEKHLWLRDAPALRCARRQIVRSPNEIHSSLRVVARRDTRVQRRRGRA
jgi:hypothetical protein